MGHALASACCAWVFNHCAHSIAVTAHLLNHEGTLSDGLEASTTTSSAFRSLSAWFSLASLASTANFGPSERHLLLNSVDCIHEVDFNREDDVFSLLRGSLLSSLLTASSKELLELFKDVTKRRLALSAALPEGILEAFEATEALESLAESTERVLAGLLLLISRHSCLIVNSSLLIVTQDLVGLIDFSELLFGAL